MATPILSMRRESTLSTFIFVSHSWQARRSWKSCVVQSERNWRERERRLLPEPNTKFTDLSSRKGSWYREVKVGYLKPSLEDQ